MITLDDLAFLTSSAGESLLDLLTTEDLSDHNALPLLTKLREKYSAEQTSTALTMARLREKAVVKFGQDAARMFFTDDGLQQASHSLVRDYRAQKIAGKAILDVCCGVGTDSLAFARHGAQVVGLDIDPVRVAIARLNANELGLKAHFEVADVCKGVPDEDATVFFDPSRRDEQGRRIFDVERYIPPLSLIRDWRAERIVVKLSPGVNLTQVDRYGGCMEFISVDGELKEAVLWLGFTASTTVATLLTNGETYHWIHESTIESAPIMPPHGWLIEPDPALIRAGLVQDAAVRFGGSLLDETIAYFTTDTAPNSPWIRAWRVVDWMPFNLKRLRTYLRERGIGRVTIKKRGSPITPEQLSAKLKLKGDKSCTLAMTRHNEQPIVLICEDYVP